MKRGRGGGVSIFRTILLCTQVMTEDGIFWYCLPSIGGESPIHITLLGNLSTTTQECMGLNQDVYGGLDFYWVLCTSSNRLSPMYEKGDRREVTLAIKLLCGQTELQEFTSILTNWNNHYHAMTSGNHAGLPTVSSTPQFHTDKISL